ncbi:hypothetical protein AAF712_003694 [Marasmius tenuissimus]|uniref:Peptidase A1 domain-containing protein n=1 Tax=Marasmius tenuissimus TaxID=585030 RepID=A0ABR3A7N5_9AGAR
MFQFNQSHIILRIYIVHSFTHESSLTEDSTESRRTMMRRVRRRVESRQASDAQTSLTLDSKVISKVVEESLGTGAKAGTYATSLTSSNNFINFCATVNLPFTNGKQFQEGSCNVAPMGIIPSINHIPSLKFQSPLNGAVLAINEAFLIRLGVKNLATGNFASSRTNFLSAPQQVDSNGLVLGHTAIVIEKLETLNQTVPTNPTRFDLYNATLELFTDGFHGFNVSKGLPAGFYRLSSVTTDANHHLIVAPLLQYGAIDDAVYFTVRGEIISRSTKREADGNPVFPRQSNTSTSSFDGDVQSSTTLLSSQVATGFANNGIDTPGFAHDGSDKPPVGQTASLTSKNNFINYCLSTNKALTNGQQSGSDSCNPIPIGAVPSSSKMPSFKFLYPKNFDVIPPNEAFRIRLNFMNMYIEMTDPQTRYLSAPQQLAADGTIKGYPQIVIEALSALNQSSYTDPLRIAFAAPMNSYDGDGVLITDASKGLPAGFYRLSSRALTANHAPLAYPELGRGTINDMIYFQVGDGGSGSTAANSISATAPLAVSTSTSIGPSESPEGGDSGSSPMALGAVIGGSIGGLVLVVLIAIFLLLLRRRRRGSGPTFGIPQSTSYPVPFINGSQMANIEPFLDISIPTGGRSKSGKGAAGSENSGSSETVGSSSRRLSVVSVAPSYHTVAPARS